METLLTPLTPERHGSLDKRQHDSAAGKEPTAKAYRTPAQRDRDRILYCSGLQRLAYVTQVTAPESGHTFHNRLSHSLKVAQVGRRNAERLRNEVAEKRITGAAAAMISDLDPDAVEASCLAHDLGHPPFGHVAEQVLQSKAKEYIDGDGGFEGNAQSFRIVTSLAVRSRKHPGLDLTRRTLDGVLKYPWSCSEAPNSTWGHYDDEEDLEAFDFARGERPASQERSLEAEIMDWADDVTYAVHDVDDFYRAGLIPLDRLTESGSGEETNFERLIAQAQRTWKGKHYNREEREQLADVVTDLLTRERFPDAPYAHIRSYRARMRDFGSSLITRYLEAFALSEDPKSGKVKLSIDETAKQEVTALKLLAKAYVIYRPGLAVVQHGQQAMVRYLFDRYLDAAEAEAERLDDGPGALPILPRGVGDLLRGADPAARVRVVVDLIAGLTEESATQLFRRLSGGWTAPALDATAEMM